MGKHPKLKFHHSPTNGRFDWGDTRGNLFERFFDAEELEDIETAMNEYSAITSEDPDFIDAYNSMALIESESMNYGFAIVTYRRAYDIGNKLIPDNFKGEILWADTDNRPFLRSVMGVGLTFLALNEFDAALNYFSQCLTYNPNDNQGARAHVIQCYIALGEFQSILDMCICFPEDTLCEIMYGKVLAFYKLGYLKEADIALKEAIKEHPLVAKELVAPTHKPVHPEIPGRVIMGSKEEAYDYWKRLGQYWTDPQLKLFIKSSITKPKKKSSKAESSSKSKEPHPLRLIKFKPDEE